MQPRAGSEYRPEIDGLRTLAIVPVVLFHFGVPGFSGGFVGVDVFFVISGFLIGGILWSELRRTGRIRLGRFFLRRIRRLAPAYYAMALISLAAAWVILLPYEFREFGKELIAATVYLSNVYFYRGAGYFDVLGEERVFLHTWSLAVEEQFYLVLPLLLLLLAWMVRGIPWLLAALALVSLAACAVMTEYASTAAFYLFPFRAWELLAGVLLGIAGHERGLAWRVHPALSWIGVALIAVAILTYVPGWHFPGVLAVPPVLGAVLVIANGQDRNLVNRILTTRPFLFFGRISYSLYLWHWPIATLSAYYAGGETSWPVRIALMGLAVLMGWLSLHLVENPVRRGEMRWPVLLGAYAAASASVIAIGAVIYLKDGLIERFGPDVRPFIEATQDFRQDWSRCSTASDGPLAGIETCALGPDGPPKVLVWGDSHARAYFEGLGKAAAEAGTPAILIWRGGCPPLAGIVKHETAATRAEDEACSRDNARIAAALGQIPSLERLLLIGRWAYYAEGSGVGRDAHNLITLAAAPGRPAAPGETQAQILESAFADTVSQARTAGLKVFVLKPTPEIFFYSSLEAARALAYRQTTAASIADGPAATARAEVESRDAAADAILDRLEAAGEITTLSTRDDLCSAETCSALQEGRAAFFDNNHVTNATAIRLRDRFRPVFGGL